MSKNNKKNTLAKIIIVLVVLAMLIPIFSALLSFL